MENENEFPELLKFGVMMEEVRPKVSGLAYSGGKMKLGWKHPVVVDIEGMNVPSAVPLLANHENLTSSRVGLVNASKVSGTVMIEGEIISKNAVAHDVAEQGKTGADWQLSIGAEVDAYELVKEGVREINGKEHGAPFYHVQKSTLREVSVVSVGADITTNMKIQATAVVNNKQTEGEAVMENVKKEENVNAAHQENVAIKHDEDAVKAERARVLEIKKLCAGEFPELEAKAIEDGISADETAKKVVLAIREKRPNNDVNIISKKQPEGASLKKSLEAALCIRSGIDEKTLCSEYGEAVIDEANARRDMSLQSFLGECLKIEGKSIPRSFGNDTIHAAFSTVSLPGILSNVANKKLLEAFRAQPVIATKLCTEGDLNDFKESERFRLTDVGDLEEVADGGEIKEGGLTENKASNQLETYGKKFCLTRKIIINDDLGAFTKVPEAMGNRAARLIDQLFFRRLLGNPVQADSKALFHASHKNLLSGADSALSATSLGKSIQFFLDQTDSDGQPISVEPRFLLVPTALKHTAIELTKGATLIIAGGANQTVRPAINVLADENLEVVSSPYLANSTYTGASSTGWYLFGDPRQIDTFEIGYLKGKRTPTVERGDTDFNTLGIWFRVYFDLGVREQDYRGMVKSIGA